MNGLMGWIYQSKYTCPETLEYSRQEWVDVSLRLLGSLSSVGIRSRKPTLLFSVPLDQRLGHHHILTGVSLVPGGRPIELLLSALNRDSFLTSFLVARRWRRSGPADTWTVTQHRRWAVCSRWTFRTKAAVVTSREWRVPSAAPSARSMAPPVERAAIMKWPRLDFCSHSNASCGKSRATNRLTFPRIFFATTWVIYRMLTALFCPCRWLWMIDSPAFWPCFIGSNWVEHNRPVRAQITWVGLS